MQPRAASISGRSEMGTFLRLLHAWCAQPQVDVPSLMSELRKLPGAQPPPPTVEASDVDPGVFPPLALGGCRGIGGLHGPSESVCMNPCSGHGF